MPEMPDDLKRRVEVVEVIPFEHLFLKLIVTTAIGAGLALFGQEVLLSKYSHLLKRYKIQSPLASFEVQPPITTAD